MAGNLPRIVLALSTILFLYPFIAVVLINVGGRGPTLETDGIRHTTYVGGYELIKWNYTKTTPDDADATTFTQQQGAFLINQNSACDLSALTKMCTFVRNDSSSLGVIDSQLLNHPLLKIYGSPFDDVKTANMDVSLGFMLMAAACTAFLALASFFSTITDARGALTVKGAQSFSKWGTRIAIFCSLCLLIAASTITGQMIRLGNQVRNLVSPYYSAYNVTLGTNVQGLIWSAWVLSIINAAIWAWVWHRFSRDVADRHAAMKPVTRHAKVQPV